MKNLINLIFTATFVSACSANIYTEANQKEHEYNYGAAYDKARISFDKGDYDSAVYYSEIAYGLNPHSDKTRVLLSYSLLGLSGLGPFDIYSNIRAEERAQDEEKLANAEEGSTEETKKEPVTISTLQEILLGGQENDAYLGFFDDPEANYPLLLPYCSETIRITHPSLIYITSATDYLCPLIPDELLIEADYRHQCDQREEKSQYEGKAVFAWGIMHLAEIILFNRIYNYKSDDTNSRNNWDNILRNLKGLNTENIEDLQKLIVTTERIKNALTYLVPSNSPCKLSVFNSMLNNILIAEQSFARISGTPKSIKKSFGKFKEKIKKLSGDEDSLAADVPIDSNILEASVTNKMKKAMESKIAAAAANEDLDSEDLNTLCNTYESLQTESNGNPHPSCP